MYYAVVCVSAIRMEEYWFSSHTRPSCVTRKDSYIHTPILTPFLTQHSKNITTYTTQKASEHAPAPLRIFQWWKTKVSCESFGISLWKSIFSPTSEPRGEIQKATFETPFSSPSTTASHHGTVRVQQLVIAASLQENTDKVKISATNDVPNSVLHH